jgi:hypothetical protein
MGQLQSDHLDADEATQWCRVAIVDDEGSVIVVCALEGHASPDLTAVDVIAHLGLVATRIGGRILVTEVAPAMRELIGLAGLNLEAER